MYPMLAKNIFHLQEKLLGRNTFQILEELEQSQWWSTEQLQTFQFTRLGQVLEDAYNHTTYWRRVMDAHGISPGGVKTLEDLRKFPLLSKETLRDEMEEMSWKAAGGKVKLTRTSGSTNEALQFYTYPNREAHINAARIRGHRWIGVNIGEKEAYFWGAPVELSKQDRVKRVRDSLINNLLTNAFELSPDVVPEYMSVWEKWCPKCLFGYPNSFVLFADMARQQGIDLGELRKFGLQVICTTSEVLGDINRKIIEEGFKVPVYDSYGLREGGLVGHECEYKTMHCMDEQLILEVIDPETLAPTDGEGELVLTNAVSSVMPVIRYRTGDIVKLEPSICRCGRKLTTLKISGGRIADFVITDKGKWIIGYSYIYICRSVSGIVKFQVIQEKMGEIRVCLVVDDNFPVDGEEQVREACRARMKSGDLIKVEIMDDIQPAKSGKYRPVVGKVAEELIRNQSYKIS